MSDGSDRVLTYAKALNEALETALAADERVFLIGEDVGEPGGVFTVTRGLWERFGGDRVIDTPIAEAAIVGAATGAAIAGRRPIVEIMFVDFTLVAADQLLNEAVKLPFLGRGRIRLPLVIRTQQGPTAVGGGGPQHSQSLEALLAHVPGFAVAMPYTPADAKGLLTHALRRDEPTIVIEHKGLYFTKGPVPDGDHEVPFGQAAVRRQGDDLTIVAYSGGVRTALAGAALLAERGIEAEVIDLRTIVPWDQDAVVRSVRRTGRALIVHEASRRGGFGAEIAATITERAWPQLVAPVRRLAGLDTPIPYAKSLEDVWLPQPEHVVEAVIDQFTEVAQR